MGSLRHAGSLQQLVPLVHGHEVQEVSQPALEEVSNRLWVVSDILLAHEGELGVLDELTEADHQAPWVRAAGLETLQEDLADLLLDDLAPSFGVDEEDDAGEVEGVVVWEAQLVHDGVQEDEAGTVVQGMHDLLEGVHRLSMPLNSRLLLTSLLCDKEYNSTDDLCVDPSSIIDYFLALLHLVADLGNEWLTPCSGEALQVFSEVCNQKTAFIFGEDSWILSDLAQEIDFEVSLEWVWLLQIGWVCVKDQVPQLNAVLGEAVDEVEVEIAEEVWKVLLDDADDSQSRMVEGLDSRRHWLSRNHVVLEE